MKSTSLSIQAPHFQNVFDNVVANANNDARMRAGGATTVDIDGVPMKRIELHRHDKTTGNFGQKLLNKAYNVLHGRKLFRQEIKAAMGEAGRLVGYRRDVQDAMHRVKIAANKTRNGHDLKASEFLKEDLQIIKRALNEENALQFAGTIVNQTNKTWTDAEARTLVRTPLLSRFQLLELKNDQSVKEGLKAAGEGDHELLAQALAQQLKNVLKTSDAATRRSFALSKGAQIRQQMFIALAGEMETGADLDALLDAVNSGYDMAVCTEASLPDTDPRLIPLPTWCVGNDGKKYEFEKELVPGAMGKVATYRCGDEKFVLKRVSANTIGANKLQDNFDATVQETLVQMAANEASDKTMKLIDVVRLPDGGLAMVLEFAPNGNLEEKLMPQLTAEERLAQMEAFKPDGVVAVPIKYKPEDEAEIVRVLEAMDELHKAGITHRDMKPQNVFGGKNGALVGDFGTGCIGEMGPVPEEVQTLNWCHPSIGQAVASIQEISIRNERNKGALKKATEALDKASPEAKAAAQAKVEDLKLKVSQTEAELRKARAVQIESKEPDKWSLACTLYQKLTGLWPFERPGDEPGKGANSNFASDRDAAHLDQQVKFRYEKTQEQQYDYLFNNPLAEALVPDFMRDAIHGLANGKMNCGEALASIRSKKQDYGKQASTGIDTRRARAATAPSAAARIDLDSSRTRANSVNIP
jgi:serine/threonine protein kinase